MQALVPYIMLGSLVMLYILSYALNKRTAPPQDCLTDIEKAACKACHNFSCSHHGGDA